MRPRHVPGGYRHPLGQMGKPRCRGVLRWPASGLCGPPHLGFVRSFFFFFLLLLSTGVLLKEDHSSSNRASTSEQSVYALTCECKTTVTIANS